MHACVALCFLVCLSCVIGILTTIGGKQRPYDSCQMTSSFGLTFAKYLPGWHHFLLFLDFNDIIYRLVQVKTCHSWVLAKPDV